MAALTTLEPPGDTTCAGGFAGWVNLSPAAVPKVGSGLDLAVAAALLAAQEHVPAAVVDRVAHVGEIGLDGTVRPVPRSVTRPQRKGD